VCVFVHFLSLVFCSVNQPIFFHILGANFGIIALYDLAHLILENENAKMQVWVLARLWQGCAFVVACIHLSPLAHPGRIYAVDDSDTPGCADEPELSSSARSTRRGRYSSDAHNSLSPFKELEKCSRRVVAVRTWCVLVDVDDSSTVFALV
jgi:hypothetical protein